jgi:hypothetical protein
MMIVGDPGRFAIQFELDESVNGEWLFGHFCFRAGGTTIGDWLTRASMATGRGLLQHLLSYRGKRRADRLMTIPATEAFAEIEAALFDDDSRSDAAVERDSAFYSRFIAIPTGFDVFDYWMAFLIEDNAKGRLIWNEYPYSESPQELWLRAGEFDAIIEDCAHKILLEATRLSNIC